MNKNLTISPYLFLFKSKNEQFLVYNGLNNSFAKVNKELYALLVAAQEDIEALNDLPQETLIVLKESLIICTPEIIQESISQKKFLKNYKTFQSEALSLTIAPTSDCNFDCPYCFEKGITHKTMSDETINKLVEYIAERSKKTQQKVNITWYGGEPLLQIDKINKILVGLKEKSIEITGQSIITNGYLLNEENFKFLTEIGVRFIQITLDGADAETHNKRRFTRNGKGSWDTIIENIDKIAASDVNINLSIRCNIDKSNKEHFYKLQTELKQRWNNNSNITIYPGILRDRHNDIHSGCSYFSDIDSSNYMIEQGIKNKKLQYFRYTVGGCSATKFNAYLVGPEGELYKCWNDLGNKTQIVGYIDKDNFTNYTLLSRYLAGPSPTDDEKCIKCKIFPICEGGCIWVRHKNLYENKKYDYLCNKKMDNFDEVFDTIILPFYFIKNCIGELYVLKINK